jgi:hypothetical protein
MGKALKMPARVYKYRTFSSWTLQLMVEDMLYFADPSTFNDPLDVQPTIDEDISPAELERILRELVERRVASEMDAAARSIRQRGSAPMDRIAEHAIKAADDLMAKVRYRIAGLDRPDDDAANDLLGWYVLQEVLQRYDHGIVSLATRANCPLMWSHYGDQHKGVCIGYSVPADINLAPVAYGGARSIKASLIRDMVDGDPEATRAVDDAVLLKKAGDWRYEREWRLIGEMGLQDCPLEMEEVVFGLRCPPTVRFALATALANRNPSIKLFEIQQKRDSFVLRKTRTGVDDLLAAWPRRARSVLEDFGKAATSRLLDAEER